MSAPFALRAIFSDGFSINLDGRYINLEAASRAASEYMRHYSDPCGLGLHVAQVAIMDLRLVEAK